MIWLKIKTDKMPYGDKESYSFFKMKYQGNNSAFPFKEPVVDLETAHKQRQIDAAAARNEENVSEDRSPIEKKSPMHDGGLTYEQRQSGTRKDSFYHRA